MPSVATTFNKSKGGLPKPEIPLWQGPCDSGDMGGITNSLLGRFVSCRERFRLLVINGLRKPHEFSHKTEYGSMWHTCEEAYARNSDWQAHLLHYARELATTYRGQQQQIDHWYNVCKTQFPIYLEHWANHKDEKARTPLLQEQVFHVPYKLPSGRVVYLRGKWDGIDLFGKGRNARIYLRERKTKGQVNPQQLKQQLQFDCQTMFYTVALYTYLHEHARAGDKLFPVDYGMPAGVYYDVIQRPLSGGKGSIVRHKPTKKNPQGESKESYYGRLADIIKDPENIGNFFMRWKVELTSADVQRFEERFFWPVLESLCNWWEFMQFCEFDPWSGETSSATDNQGLHWQHPYGIYSVLDEGGSTGYDEYLATGSKLGLEHTTTLFDELR